jgi:very-short-patch-repair endonuclease
MVIDNKTIKQLCRDLRKRQTLAEQVLWKLLRNRRLKGYKFLRQHPLAKIAINGRISFYIADFYCAEKRIVIEADGSIHEERKEYDANRDEVVQSYNIRTIRFKNELVINQTSLVIDEILKVLEAQNPRGF